MKASRLAIRAALVSAVSVQGLVGVAYAQTAEVSTGVEDIIVTAQRQAQSLQDVPIAVSAFSSESLAAQQINNSSQLQLTLPNITFTKGNFTGSSFTIRGVGDLCVGATCDSATAIHMNDLPLFGTRLFETEFFDLDRVEVLRGPQGTLFGRNATAGVVNFVTGKPDASALKASGEALYGNYNEIRLQGMINVPITDRFAARVAGFYLKRDGYTENLFNGSDIDGRDMFALRGSLRWEPTENTTIDLMGYWFKEDDNRLRIQKQLCQRDPSGVLGCLPGRLENGVTNGNSTLSGILTSREFLGNPAILGAAAPALGPLALGSLYGPDAYAGNVNPSDPRQVFTAFEPSYRAEEIHAMARIEHDFGPVRAKVSGLYQENSVDSSQDYNLNIQRTGTWGPGLGALAAYAGGALGPGFAQLGQAYNTLLPSGPAGPYCVSTADPSGVGVFAGNSVCANTPLAFDRSQAKVKAYTIEGILSTQFDGQFNFLVGGIWNRVETRNTDYYVNGFQLDYASAMLGIANTLGAQAVNPAFPNSYAGTPFFRSNTERFDLDSYGLFGEAYWEATDRLKFTVGLRYNNDRKFVRARTTLYSDTKTANAGTDALGRPIVVSAPTTALVPYSATNFTQAVNYAALDFDPTLAGLQPFQENSISFDEMTGRFVVDYRITDDNLVYASYSRGYKSGGINPPLSPIFEVPFTFEPEQIDSFEIGSKNRFLDGTLQLNLTGFYYKYKGLQLSRIVARTSVNDNVDANIWGVEVEGIVRPIAPLTVNLGFSYLKTEVTSDKFLGNPRDPSGGRSDAVIIKDITNASNCALVPTQVGNAAGANLFVGAVNSGLGLNAPAPFAAGSGINGATGAFGICSALATTAANPPAGLRALFGVPTGSLPFVVESAGVPVNIRGNELPQAPEFKASVGVQWVQELASGISIVPRWDLAFTGASYGNIFNGAINRVPSYEVMNAQVQVNGVDNKWYVRAFIQNITNNNATTGLNVTDQSSGLFTNIFTLEPRRYGLAAGFNF
ncbi:MAG: TonB-dependent receptor [Sandaracinobacter sp.]